LSHLYWSILSLSLGACIGSFLNVIAYRWPRNISIIRPSRSFCPNCEHHISWYENIPVLSYLALGGRCRSCRQPISLQYPVVEIVTALTFLMTYDVFFVAQQRQGIGKLETDWPMLLGHWALWAGLITLTVMDLEAYMIDIRVTWIVSAVGVVAHVFWTPVSSSEWLRPGVPGSAMALAAILGLAIGGLIFLRRDWSPPQEEEPPPPATQDALSAPAVRVRATTWITLALLLAGLLGYVFWFGATGEQAAYHPPESIQWRAETTAPSPAPSLWWDAGAMRLLTGFVLLFAALTWSATRPEREADVEIVEAIHAEANQSRRVAIQELLLISPAVILGVAALILAGSEMGPAYAAVGRVIHWKPMGGDWQPLWGLSTALFGWIIGGAMGWLCRIIFTLVLGKEALGMGDVHLLAAAGAVAGWPVAVLGFFAASLLALLGILIILIRRRSRAIALVPWLALAFMLCFIFQDRILAYLGIRWMLNAPLFSSRVLGVQP
jgi:prepilin signal peptidase PulO-like enzyme (type II secretory pathway)